MTGVTILTSTQVATDYAFNFTIGWILFGIIFSICLICGIWQVITDSCEWSIIPWLSLIGAIAGLFLGAWGGTMFCKPIAYETQYKVTISDEVSMTEFCKYYEVIDQEDQLFIIREKNK
jgi:hypothetical protein